MKRALMSAIVAAVALTSLAGAPAMAQGWEPDRNGPPPHAQHGPDRNGPDRNGPGWNGPQRHDDRRPDARWHDDRRPDERHWRAGDRLPKDYRAKRHIITKPAAYHLHRPPRGHHWVRVGPDALLVVSATGIVVEFAPGLFR
ncbi:RcnB family protein [Azospirillum doebereinerae]|nr:RcnB family protein [Azospirillum doebereinerae]MCG5240895.1 RcnB family protein [Azospirillum doebereinerae]